MEKTWKPTTAGILTILRGSTYIAFGIGAIALGVLDWSTSWIGKWAGIYRLEGLDIKLIVNAVLGVSPALFLVISIVALTFGIIALVGGISAIKRRRWGLALAGSILSLPGVLAILAIIFVSIGKEEFK